MPYPFLKRWMRVSALTKSRLQNTCRYECVVLSAFASRWHDCLAGLAAAAERLVHSSTTGENERAVHRRLSMLALFAPLLLAAGLVQTLAETLGASKIVALVALVIASGWLAGLLLSLTGRRQAVELALLGMIICFECRDHCRRRRHGVAAGAARDDAADRGPVGPARPGRADHRCPAVAGDAARRRSSGVRSGCRPTRRPPGTGSFRPSTSAPLIVRAATFIGERGERRRGRAGRSRPKTSSTQSCCACQRPAKCST